VIISNSAFGNVVYAELEYNMFQRLMIASGASVFAIITFLFLVVLLQQHFRVPKRENEKKNVFLPFLPCVMSVEMV
jgi:phosphotransferase system  glucose/maltose/N-acetylglucosamine-specific IIC component